MLTLLPPQLPADCSPEQMREKYWPPLQAKIRSNIVTVFNVWLVDTLALPRSKSERMLDAVRNYLLKNQKKFVKTTTPVGDLPSTVLGYLLEKTAGKDKATESEHSTAITKFLFTDSTFKAACGEFSTAEVAKELKNRGLLVTQGNDNHLKSYYSVPCVGDSGIGIERLRLYAVNSTLLSYATEEPSVTPAEAVAVTPKTPAKKTTKSTRSPRSTRKADDTPA